MVFARFTLCAAALMALCAPAMARDNVQIAGSSTVLPYASIVAEAFAENFDFPTPVVESGGSSAGLKRFCEGVGQGTIDIANASRAIRPREAATCAKNGVDEIIEVRIGYDGIVFASRLDGPAFTAFTPADWFGALAKRVLVEGELTANPHTHWSEVNPDLPDVQIAAYIPGTKHGTREVFEEKVLLQGCKDSGAMQAMLDAGMEKEKAERACISVRTDGKSVDIDGDYTETLARLGSNRAGVGVFGLAFYENNTGRLTAATINGVEATTASIASGDYPVSRPLYFYIKKAHIGVIPGLKDYAAFFVADEVAGPGGPLATYGLVPDPKLGETQATVADETLMQGGR